MNFFTEGQLAIIESAQVRVATLVELHFEEVLRFWNGDHSLEINGNIFYGSGVLGAIDGLTDMRTSDSSQVVLKLSGTDAAINALAVKNSAEQEGAFAYISLQFFDPEWKTVGSPIRIFTGITQPATASRQSAEDGQGPTRSITLPCENLFFGRSRPPASLYTSQDQSARYPSPRDKFFDFQSQVARGVSYIFP